MSITQRIKGLLDVMWGTAGADSWGYAQAWERGLDLPAADAVTLTKPYVQHPVVATALEIIADDAASVPLALHRKGPDGKPDGDAMQDDPLLALLARPNPLLTGRDIWVLSYLHYLLFGEWFWYAPDLRLGRGGPRAVERVGTGTIDVLYPPAVRHKIRDGVPMWALREAGRDRPLDSDALYQHRRINPYDPIRGVSKLAALTTDLEADANAAAWNKRFFGDQNGIPGGLLKPGTGANLTPDQRRDVLQHWNQRHGSGNRSIGLLPAGWDFVDQSQSQRDMDYRGLREYARELALGLLGVPPFMAGVLDKANYANARKQEEVYWLGTIARFLSGVCNWANASLLPRLGYADRLLVPQFDDVRAMIEDFDAKTATGERLWKMGVPLDVVNERLGLRLTLDDVALSDQAFVTAGVIPIEQAGAPEPMPNEPPPAGTRGLREQIVTTQRAARWRRIDRARMERERAFEKAVRWHFRKIRAEVLANLDGPKGVLFAHQRGPNDSASHALFDRVEADARLRRVTAREYERSIKRAASFLLLEMGVAAEFDMESPRVLALLGTLRRKIVGINDTIERTLRSALQLIAGQPGGTTVEELRDEVRRVMDVSLGRARTIAQTEVGTAYNGGRFEAMRQTGVQRISWLSSHDADVRDSHAAVDGEVIEIGETFSNGLTHPNDPAGPPGEVINCRCTSTPVMENQS